MDRLHRRARDVAINKVFSARQALMLFHDYCHDAGKCATCIFGLGSIETEWCMLPGETDDWDVYFKAIQKWLEEKYIKEHSEEKV